MKRRFCLSNCYISVFISNKQHKYVNIVTIIISIESKRKLLLSIVFASHFPYIPIQCRREQKLDCPLIFVFLIRFAGFVPGNLVFALYSYPLTTIVPV